MKLKGNRLGSSLTLPTVALLLLSSTALWAVRTQEDWFRTGTGMGVEKFRLAVPDFRVVGLQFNPLGETFNRVLWADLEYSGVFDLVSKSFYPLVPPAAPEELRPQEWVAEPVNTHLVVFGYVNASSTTVAIGAWVYDVRNPRSPPVLAKVYRGDASEGTVRQLAHQLADEIVSRLSGGLPGIAQSRIAFVSNRTGSKEIWLMDYDGHNQVRLTYHNSISLAPRWSPDGTRVAFTTYAQGKPDIQIHSLVTNRRVAFPTYPNTTTTLAWSPDGRQVAFSSSLTGNQEIYVSNSDGSNLRRLTDLPSVDISPAWNPRTGQQIAFVSDRGGAPQIYLMDADGANVERLTSGEGYATSPAWSPNGQMIAFAWQKDLSSFDVYVLDVATRRTVQLTYNGGRNEQPVWAPDGRHLVFQSNRSGRDQIWTMLADGTQLRQLTLDGSNSAPQWSWR